MTRKQCSEPEMQDEVNFARGAGASADSAFKRYGREWIEHLTWSLGTFLGPRVRNPFIK